MTWNPIKFLIKISAQILARPKCLHKRQLIGKVHELFTEVQEVWSIGILN